MCVGVSLEVSSDACSGGDSQYYSPNSLAIGVHFKLGGEGSPSSWIHCGGVIF